MKLLFLTVSALLVSLSSEYSIGGPDSACKGMTPGHAFDSQPEPSPYKLSMDKGEVVPGQRIALKLEGTEGKTFKGFMIQARNVADKDSQVGSFLTEDGSYMTCGRGIHNSITHRNSDDKSGISAEWVAPSDFEGEVVFRYSAVQQYDVYWTKMDSEVVRVTRSAISKPEEEDKAAETDEDVEVIVPDLDTIIEGDTSDYQNDEDSSSVTFPDSENSGSSSSSSTTRRTTTTTATTTTTTTTTSTTTRRTTTPEPTAVDQEHEIFDGCGSSKTCFGIPENCVQTGGCSAVVSYELSGQDWLFKMVGRTDGYLSLGLSSDPTMGEDLTSTCYYNQPSGEVDILSGYNPGYWNEVLVPSKFAIEKFEGRYEDGFLSCNFKRPYTVKVEKHDKTFNLGSDKYVIFLAEGAFVDGAMRKHRTKDKSSEPQALGIVSNLVADTKLFTRLHGAFMIGAWIFSASAGIFLARYYKQTWTNAKCAKLDQWFIWHRFFMMTTWVLTIAGVILIFMELRGWTKIPITENPHALLGCITTGLCFMQPFIALMRCHPDHKNRAIFNWVHWFVGNSAQIVGIVAIFFAVELDKAELPKETDYLLIAFVAFHFLMHLVLSILMCSSDMKKDKQGYSSYPMRNLNGAKGLYPDYEELKRDAPGSGVRKFFLFVYLLVITLVAAALILLVVFAPTRPILEEAGILKPE